MLFLLDNYLSEQASGLDKNLMEPKVRRLIKLMREEIRSIEGTSKEEIIKDSATLGSNMWNLLSNKLELTKEQRMARIKMWKIEAKNKYKKTNNIKNLYSME